MIYKLELKEEALEELSEAYRWHEDKQQGLGEYFFNSTG